MLAACVTFYLIRLSVCYMAPKIVGGQLSNINDFPYTAYLISKCVKNGYKSYFRCGSSIVNQKILLTAAHCMNDCEQESYFFAYVGHTDTKKGDPYSGHSYMVHENYEQRSTDNDIGLVKLNKALQFSSIVKRIGLMRTPPYKEKAVVAGWGYSNEIERLSEGKLKFVDQYVWSPKYCLDMLNNMPKGTICASSGNEDDYVAIGDSGSALVVRGYIQLGIVSFKKPSVSRSVVVYTDTGYFYKWIKENAEILYCNKDCVDSSNKNS